MQQSLSCCGLAASLQATSCSVRHSGLADVQPVDPLELWDTPPFEPEVDRKDKMLFHGRGVSDDKGGLLQPIHVGSSPPSLGIPAPCCSLICSDLQTLLVCTITPYRATSTYSPNLGCHM